MIEVYSRTVDGVTFAYATDKGEIIVTTFRADQKAALKSILDSLPFGEPFQVFHEAPPSAKAVIGKLKAIYEGKESDVNLPLATTNLPAYTKRVLKATLAIPVGYVTTYGAIAEAVGGGPRAVGNTMACNRFAPIIPCHRVIKSDLTLGGYGAGGLKVKLEFLIREKRGYTQPKKVEVCGGILELYPVEYVLSKFACDCLRKS
jgi:methylated-DNA-[protein]-cysteine S-methyltransferase